MISESLSELNWNVQMKMLCSTLILLILPHFSFMNWNESCILGSLLPIFQTALLIWDNTNMNFQSPCRILSARTEMQYLEDAEEMLISILTYFFWTVICFVCAIYSKCLSSFYDFIIAYTNFVLLCTVTLICSLWVCSASWLQEPEETASHFFHLSSINECLIRRFVSFVYSLDQDSKLGHKTWWQIPPCSFKG